MMFVRMEENQGPLIADIAAHVFSFLSVEDKQNVAKVCRNWRRIVYLAGLWRDVTVELPLHPSHELVESLKVRGITRITCLRSKEEHLSDLVNSIPNLTHLNITGCPQVGEEFLVKVIPSLSCLEHVGFRRCRQVTDRLLKTMSASNLPKILKSLVLEECEFVTHVGFKALMKTSNNLENLDLKCVINDELNNSCLEVLSDSCPKLTSLTIHECQWVTYSRLECVTRKLRNIKHLDLQCCEAVTNDAIKLFADNLDLEFLHINSVDLTGKTLLHVASNLKGLQSLSCCFKEDELEQIFVEVLQLQQLESLTIHTELDFVNWGMYLEKKTIDLCILSSLEQPSNLRKLVLGRVTSISDTTVIQLAEYLPHLEELIIFDCPNIKEAGITALCSKLKCLRVLEVCGSGITDKGVKEMSSKLGNLKTLALKGILISAGIKHLAINLESLTVMDLFECSNITDTDVELIALCMPQLVKLDLYDCVEVTDEGAIAIGKKLKNLHYLSLTATQISSKGFVCLSQNLIKLEVLGVGHCSISDKALVKGAMSLGNLKKFVFGSEQTTDEGLEEAVQYLSGLTEMELDDSDNITVRGIENIVKGLSNLNHLVIWSCNQITEELVAHLGNSKVKIIVDM